jgi:predicted dehydrogenase
MNKKLSLCIVGCGSYAHVVMEYIADMIDELEFSFASRNIDKAKEYCEQYGGSAYYGSYEDAAADPRVDAMYFITPHDLHLDNARLAAKHGKHVLMEKPIARTVREARDLIAATKQAGVTLMVGENFRFDPATEKAKELIAQGAIGNLSLIDIQSENLDGGCVGWRLSLERCGGGRMIDGGIHYVDVLRNLAGSPDSVYALAPEHKMIPGLEGEDSMVLTASFPGGLTGFVRYAGWTPHDSRRDVRLTGTKGRVRYEVFGSDVTVETKEGARSYPVEPEIRGMKAMMRDFIEAVAGGHEPTMNGQEALDDLAVVLAAYESVKTGAPVKVADIL